MPKPTKDPNGEAMKVRHIRTTDKQWEDAKLVGMDRTRTFFTVEAAKIRAKRKAK